MEYITRGDAIAFGEWLAFRSVELSFASDAEKASEGLPLSTEVFSMDDGDTWKTMEELYKMWLKELRQKAKKAVEKWPNTDSPKTFGRYD